MNAMKGMKGSPPKMQKAMKAMKAINAMKATKGSPPKMQKAMKATKAMKAQRLSLVDQLTIEINKLPQSPGYPGDPPFAFALKRICPLGQHGEWLPTYRRFQRS